MPWLPGVFVGIMGASDFDQKSRVEGVVIENLASWWVVGQMRAFAVGVVGCENVERHRARECVTHARGFHVGWCRVGLVMSRGRRTRGRSMVAIDIALRLK